MTVLQTIALPLGYSAIRMARGASDYDLRAMVSTLGLAFRGKVIRYWLFVIGGNPGHLFIYDPLSTISYLQKTRQECRGSLAAHRQNDARMTIPELRL